MTDTTLLKRMFEQNFKLNEPIETTLKQYEACYFNGTVWTRATALIPPTGFLAQKLVNDVGNISLGSEVPIDSITNTALSAPIVTNLPYYYDPATQLLNTVGTGWKVGTGYAGAGSDSQYGSILVNLNQPVAPGGAQAALQLENEGVALGGAGTVDELDFVGPFVEAIRVGNKVTVFVTAGQGDMLSSNNLADVADIGISRNNLDVPSNAQAVHKTGVEVIAGSKTFTDVSTFTLLANFIAGAFSPAQFEGINTFKSRTTLISTAEILNSFSSNVTLVPAPGAGFATIVQGIEFTMDYNSVAYNTNTTSIVSYGFGGNQLANITGAFLLERTADTVLYVNNLFPRAEINQPVVFYVDTGNPLAGNSNITAKVYYRTVAI